MYTRASLAPAVERAEPPKSSPVRSGPLFRPIWGRLRGEVRDTRYPTEPNYALARSRRMKTCGRSVLFWSLGFYVVVALALNAVMDHWCPAPFEKVYRTKWDELCRLTEAAPDRSLVVMIGSSRTDGGFQASMLEDMPGPDGKPMLVYNFGVPAAGPLHEYLYLREMLGRGIRPRLLIVEFLPPLFNDANSRLISEENWTRGEWISPIQVLRMAPYFARPGRKAREWLEARTAPWFVYRSYLHTQVQELLEPPSKPVTIPWYHDRWGWRYPETLSPAEYAFRASVARDYIPTLGRFRPGAGPAQAMRDLLACCRREQIPVVLVLTPESTEFRSWYSTRCHQSTYGLLEEIRAAYGVPVIDATRWIEDRDFVDGHHLDAGGARIYTERLRDEVRRILE
jgi:hypothetical protein